MRPSMEVSLKVQATTPLSTKTKRSREAGDAREDRFRTRFPIVGVGASAGGLEAFTRLLKFLPTDTGMALVLVQHLDAHHESVLTHLLARATSIPVQEATDRLRVEPDHVYVIPPNVNLTIAKGFLRLQPRQVPGGVHRCIDSFLESLAQDRHERAIGVILSGNASDGTLGLEAIKSEGGITFAQDDSAKYGSMPRSAIAAGCVDFVLSPETIASELTLIAKHPYLAAERKNQVLTKTASTSVQPPYHGLKDSDANGLRGIFALLRSHYAVDFSSYKPGTIERRINRRMVLNKQKTLSKYATFIKQLRELTYRFASTKKQKSPWFEGVVKRGNNSTLKIRLHVYQKVPAADEVKAREWRVV